MATSLPTAYAAGTSAILPGAMYPYAAFIKSSGISKTRIREARLQGVDLPKVTVGRRIFVRGADAVEYIEQLAELSAKESA